MERRIKRSILDNAAMFKAKKLILLALFTFAIQAMGYGQATVILERYVCPGETYSEYRHDEIKAKQSDGVCNTGTRIRVKISGNKDIATVTTDRFGDGDSPHEVEVNVEWVPGKTGIIIIDVYYQRKVHKSLGNCNWRDLSYMYTYKLYRLASNPGGSLTGPDELTATDEQSPVSYHFDYLPDLTGPGSSEARKIRYSTNGTDFEEEDIVKSDGQYVPTSLAGTVTGYGSYNLTTVIVDACGDPYPGPSQTFTVYPSCYKDNPQTPPITLTGVGIEEFEGKYKVKQGERYALNVSDEITDFSSHYTWNVADGGQDVAFDGSHFTVQKGLGSYRIDAVKKPGRELCWSPAPISIFVGGNDVSLEQTCPITLPDDIDDLGFPNVDPDDIVLEHFAATVKSKRGVIVKPGVTLSLGAELFVEYPMEAPEGDLNMNYVQETSYDEYGRVAGEGRAYFDYSGTALQNQYKDLSTDVVLATENLYDAYQRPVISTLPAPIRANTETAVKDECGEDAIAGDKIKFEYKSNFVTAADGTAFDYTDFDLDNEQNPGVLGTQEGTLGWYYSEHNGASTNKRMNEPLVASTQYPYSRTLFHHDGSGEVKSATKPGDAFKAGGGHIGSVTKEPVVVSDPYLAKYLAMRQEEIGLTGIVAEGMFFQTIAIDETGKKSVDYTDRSGNTVISLYFGAATAPVTKSYQFYDNAGRLKVSVSPNGVAQYEGISQVPFGGIDKTTYFYNNKGLLAAVEETDAGRTEYIYRKDGTIRFSQNAVQRTADGKGPYSYTHYDRSERPVESGEYVPAADGIMFASEAMTDILENKDADGGLALAKGTRRHQLTTVYDVPDAVIPGARIQRFVQGAVSATQKSDDITTWYSYDERGRVEWMVQQIKDLGIKTIDYRYGPTGQVQEVLYQKGVSAEQFSHYYEYDADGALSKTYTATSELQYNKEGEITNPGVLKLQATYHYYLHGPLKRIELADKLQGIDYIYTADGALKSINSAGTDVASDPGKDGSANSAFRKDVFGMTLDYYAGDYNSHGNTLTDVTISDTYEAQYSGLIRAMRWHSPVEEGAQTGYAYTYDARNQFSKADWGTVNLSNSFITKPAGQYHEAVTGYDHNGNIDGLLRRNSNDEPIADFEYVYMPNTNKLDNIIDRGTQGHPMLRDYDYNAIGSLTYEKIGDNEKYIEYDVTGKVTKVFSDAAKTRLLTAFVYDDRGFRLSKTTYNESGIATLRTWYVRDASGTVMGTYEHDLTPKEEENDPDKIATLTELPVYGSGRIGLYKPQFNYTQYELNDHLGNVRAVIGRPMEVEYLATMESERYNRESNTQQGDFDHVENDATAMDINHTPAIITVNKKTENITEPNEVNRLNNMPVSGQPTSPIGTGMLLWVHPGDTINAEVFVKYANFNSSNQNVVAGLAAFLSTAFGASPVIDGPSIFSAVEEPGFASLPAWNKLDEDQPQAFLNYLLFDSDFKLQGFDFDQVSTAAAITAVPSEHERLELKDVTIKKEGYLYIYVSNLGDQNMEVYFDDLRVKHTYSDIVGGADFYPFGLTIEDRQIEREYYRHGYQGAFTEKDHETGWDHFELREYDPVIGRWLVRDPMREHWSPYLAMGNNPVNKTDPDGGCDGCKGGIGDITTINGKEFIWDGDHWGPISQEVVFESTPPSYRDTFDWLSSPIAIDATALWIDKSSFSHIAPKNNDLIRYGIAIFDPEGSGQLIAPQKGTATEFLFMKAWVIGPDDIIDYYDVEMQDRADLFKKSIKISNAVHGDPDSTVLIDSKITNDFNGHGQYLGRFSKLKYQVFDRSTKKLKSTKVVENRLE